MNFKVNKKELLNALNICSRAISNTTPLPSLTGIKFLVEQNKLTLISSDSNISIKIELDNSNSNILEVFEEGEIVIDSKYILEIIRKIDSEFINIEIIDGTLIKIFGGNSEFKINCMKASEYPQIAFESNGNSFNLNSNLFKQIIDETAFACSEKETRPVLTGVNFKTENNVLKVNATDSYRLASKTIKLENVNDFNITIPNKYLIDIYHSLDDNKEITLQIDNQKILFKFDNILIQTRLLDDIFPDTSKLIPSSFTQTLVLKSKELYSAIDRASFIKSDGKNIVKLSINSDSVDITANNQTSSSFESIKPVSFEGNSFEISCSGKYLQDAINALDSEEIVLSFSGDLKPMILNSKNDENIVQLISPVRTYK